VVLVSLRIITNATLPDAPLTKTTTGILWTYDGKPYNDKPSDHSSIACSISDIGYGYISGSITLRSVSDIQFSTISLIFVGSFHFICRSPKDELI
jgi:hypothetical protein